MPAAGSPMRSPGLRVEHLHHHADDVARGAELAVGAGDVEFAEQVFVEVALHILVLAGDVELSIARQASIKQGGFVDLELGVGHVLAEGAGPVAEVLEVGEDLVLHLPQGLLGGQLAPVRPAEFLAVVGLGKRDSDFLPRMPGGALGVLLALVELLEEEQKRELLDGIQRVGEAAGPELVPEGVDSGAEFGVSEHEEYLNTDFTDGHRCSYIWP